MDSNPYLNGTIGILSDSAAFLYNDDASWAVRVSEVKRGVDRVHAKVDKVRYKLRRSKRK